MGNPAYDGENLTGLLGSEFYKAIYVNSPEAIVVLDNRGKFIAGNGRMEEWLGYRAEEFVGHNLLSLPFLPPKSKAIVAKNFAARMMGRKIPEYMIEFKAKDGKIRVGEIRGAVVKSEDGRAVGEVVMIADVTGTSRIKQDLERSEQYIEEILKHTDQVFFVTGADLTSFQYVSENVINLTGYTVEEIKENWTVILDNGEFDRLAETVARGVKGGGGRSVYVVKATTKGGVRREIEIDESEVVDDSGQIIQRIGVMRDVTERENLRKIEIKDRELEKVVQRLSARFVTVGDQIGDLINEALGELGRTVGADRAYLFDIDEGEITVSNSYEWCSEGIEPQISKLQGLSVNSFGWWMGKLKSDYRIIITDVGEMPPEAHEEKEILTAQGAKSLVAVSLSVDSAIAGFLVFVSVNSVKEWEESTVILLKTAAEIIGRSIERMKARQALADRVLQLELLNNSTVGRELKMVKLKERIKELEGDLQRRITELEVKFQSRRGGKE